MKKAGTGYEKSRYRAKKKDHRVGGQWFRLEICFPFSDCRRGQEEVSSYASLAPRVIVTLHLEILFQGDTYYNT